MTRTIPALIAAAAAFLGPAAGAPSFDCTKASGAVETAICKSATLSAADRKLADTYTALIRPAGRGVLRDGQRQWLSYRTTICTKPAHEDSVENCLKNLYERRQEQLGKAIVRSGGLSFLRTDVFQTRKQPPESNMEPWYQPYSTLESSWPAIESPKSPPEKAFNAAMAGMARQATNGFSEGGTDFWFDFDDIQVTDKLISVRTTTSFYGHGAAHPNHGDAVFHWLRAEGRLMKADDVFTGPKWKAALRDYCFGKVKREFFVEKVEDLGETTSDPGRWLFTRQGLTVIFNPYEVASYAEGMQQVVVPWGVLKPYLKKNAPVTQ